MKLYEISGSNDNYIQGGNEIWNTLIKKSSFKTIARLIEAVVLPKRLYPILFMIFLKFLNKNC